MTNNEAIEILKERIELSNEMLTKPFFQDAQETIRKTIEAYKVAIKALEYDGVPCGERLPEDVQIDNELQTVEAVLLIILISGFILWIEN